MSTKNRLRSRILVLASLFLASFTTAEFPVPGFSGWTTRSACAQPFSMAICGTLTGIYRCNCECTFVYSNLVYGGFLTPEEGGDFFLDCIGSCGRSFPPPPRRPWAG